MAELITSFDEFVGLDELLGPDFAAASWSNWKLTIRAALGEYLDPNEQARFRELAGRDRPPHRVRELWLAIGRRGGKDSIASAIASYLATCSNFQNYLRRGERAVILCLAVNREQAAIVFSYIRANFAEVPLLADMVERIGDSVIELSNGIDIQVATANFRGIRGKTIACAIFDEVAYWFSDDTYVNPDKEIYSAILPAMTTLRQAGALLIGISTVYKRSGLLFDKWHRYHGTDDPDVLVIRQPAAIYNPNLDNDPLLKAEITRERIEDPERAAAEWDSIWRSDLADFVDRQAVEACVAKDRFELLPQPTIHYRAFIDTSGSGADSYTLAIGHRDRQTNKSILDLVREIRPPFSPEKVTQEFVSILRTFHIGEVTGDAYGGEWPRDAFRRRGIHYMISEKVKSQIYVEFLPLINSGRVELLDHQRLIHQLTRLERRTGRGTGTQRRP
jgi:hypothetical protein